MEQNLGLLLVHSHTPSSPSGSLEQASFSNSKRAFARSSSQPHSWPKDEQKSNNAPRTECETQSVWLKSTSASRAISDSRGRSPVSRANLTWQVYEPFRHHEASVKGLQCSRTAGKRSGPCQNNFPWQMLCGILATSLATITVIGIALAVMHPAWKLAAWLASSSAGIYAARENWLIYTYTYIHIYIYICAYPSIM